jgi:hypothetical protein
MAVMYLTSKIILPVPIAFSPVVLTLTATGRVNVYAVLDTVTCKFTNPACPAMGQLVNPKLELAPNVTV